MTDEVEKEAGKEIPKYLYRYISIERLAEVIMTKSLPIPYPKNWNDQHDLDNALNKIPSDEVVGIACLTKKWETSFHWDLFAKYGVRLAFDTNRLVNRVHSVGGKIEKVNYVSTPEYIEKMEQKEDLLFVKRSQYKPEREWRIVCRVPAGQMATKNVVKYVPFEWDNLLKITISPHFEVSDYHFYKAMILKMLKAVGAEKVKVLHSSLFESNKVRNAEDDFEEDEK